MSEPNGEGVRLDGTSETVASSRHKRWSLVRRLTLRRADGEVYLDRWGIAHERIGRILLHRMEAPDPGVDLHDHPWWFVTIPLWGGYTEQRARIREAPAMAVIADRWPDTCTRGVVEQRKPWRPKTMRLDECHTITHLSRRTCWTLVIGGPRRRAWGFYMPDGWISEYQYDHTVRAERRDLWSDQNETVRPW